MMVVTYGSDYREWKLFSETRVEDPKQFVQFCRSSSKDDDGPDRVSHADITGLFTHDAHSALMLIGTSDWWSHYEGPIREGLWRPTSIRDAVDSIVPFYEPRPTN
jgi:hypothetical protein